MRLILQSKSGLWRLSDMDTMHLDLLRQAAEDASMTDCPEGRVRLFPLPVSQEDELPEGEFLEDWREFVSDELETQFAGDVGVMLDDLDDAEPHLSGDMPEEKLFRLDVPLDHGQAWFSALNQARLMLDIKFKLHPGGDEFMPDDEMEGIDPHERLAAYMRYEFFAVIQEWLVRKVLD